MFRKLKYNFQLIRNMGLRYIVFRIFFELKKKTGIFKSKFPQDPKPVNYISLSEWRKGDYFFGIDSNHEQKSEYSRNNDAQRILNGEINFFSNKWIKLGKDYDWVTNPDSSHKYDRDKHWSQIEDFSAVNGDIKYVWEKSRFSYIYEILRNDLAFDTDHSAWIFQEIVSWIKANPINSGPNYKCSQEISLRVLNWTYALNFYKNSAALTEDIFDEIMHSVYWQLSHVYENIDFSRIAVRNNHAITETLTLYLSGLFYPFFPDANKWKKKGKKWFEQEIDYQIYPDGTFLQFSMNYHRVVIQLFTWAFSASIHFKERFSKTTYEKAYKSIKFLYTCQDLNTGFLPNYGSNDGALFFKFTACDFRDYRPQLNVLHKILTGEHLYSSGPWDEELCWYNIEDKEHLVFEPIVLSDGWTQFEAGGFYVLRETTGVTFIRCGNHKDRPAQADNLHLDIWYKDKNVVYDSGSYKYNTDSDTLKYFMGTQSHNTVMINDADQMLKGARFIWYYWSQREFAKVYEGATEFVFEGKISAFRFLNTNIKHYRKIIKRKSSPTWIVEDVIENLPENSVMKQNWHCDSTVELTSQNDPETTRVLGEGWRSDYYGIKNSSPMTIFETQMSQVKTSLTIK